MTDQQLIVAPDRVGTAAYETNDQAIVGITPKRLFYGVVAAGFFYNLKFSVQNNSLVPIRIRIACTPYEGEQNAIRVVYLPDKIAPGMSVQMTLELTAEFVASSMFTLQISQSADPRVYSRLVEANVISPETFKYVKKSLQLQNRPIYRHNVTSVGGITNPSYENGSISTPVTSFSETLIMDDEDIEDLLDLPMVQNSYWDPFSKLLRLDPECGRVIVDKSLTLEESLVHTAARRKQRLEDLDEQGFYTIEGIGRLRQDHTNRTALKSIRDEEEDEDEEESSMSKADEDEVDVTMMSSRTSLNSRRTSVSSMMAMKREKIERLRRATIDASAAFSENTKKDSMVNSMRTLSMIQGRQNNPSPKRGIAT